jgi:acyl-coenzyme A synthetase/AMP-(fatty) acid ligase
VIGVADPQSAGNEVPRAYIVADASQISVADVKSWVKSSLASHKQLRGGVIFIEAIPKSATGKILRRQLRDLAVKENSFAVKL